VKSASTRHTEGTADLVRPRSGPSWIERDNTMKVTQGLNLLPNTDGKPLGIDKKLDAAQQSFGETLTQAITDVNALQSEAGSAVQKMVAGQPVDLHEVMIAAEKARTSFDLLLEIRNKTIDMYRELMRMQV
jgi:flagellar hook-basal body complex protein FliE